MTPCLRFVCSRHLTARGVGGGDRDHRAVTDHCCWPPPSIILLDHLLWFLLRYDSTHTTRDTATLHLAIAPPLSLSPYLCTSTVWPCTGLGWRWEYGMVDPTDTCHVGHTTLWYAC